MGMSHMTSPEEYEAAVKAAATAETENTLHGNQAIHAVRATQELARQVIVDLQTEKVAARLIRDKTNAEIGPKDTKDLARVLIRIADATIDFARLVIAMGIDPGDPPSPNGA